MIFCPGRGPPLQKPLKYSGRLFTAEEIDWIRSLIQPPHRYNRVALSRLVCQHLHWLNPKGRPKEMSCRVALLQMHREGLIALPKPLNQNNNQQRRPKQTQATDPQFPITRSAGELGEILFRQVLTRKQSSFWNQLIDRYHYLGYQPLPGAQIRYLVYSGPQILAALGFGAAAWKVAARDRWIGWTHQQRQKNLHLIVNNARFLILPWVSSKNLASKILSQVAKQLPLDWQERYAYQPVLLETFVEQKRFKGTCYKAANWIHVGQTQGRGKLDRLHQHPLPIKDILLYPLLKDWRSQLLS